MSGGVAMQLFIKIIPARDPKQWGVEKEARLVVVMMMTMTHT